MNIPTIPGLEPHPVQVAEQQRIAAMRAESPGSAAPGETPQAKSSLMPDPTREALKKLAEAMRAAAGIAAPAPEPAITPKRPGAKPAPAPGPNAVPTPAPAKRAEGAPPGPALPRNDTIGAAQPSPTEPLRRAVP
jgi:penicillin-binding protein 1A